MAVSGAYKVNDALVVPGEAAEAEPAVAADYSGGSVWMHKVRYM